MQAERGSFISFLEFKKNVFLSRYISEAEKYLMSKVILSLENVQYLSIQSVASNDLGMNAFNQSILGHDFSFL